jgi:Alginate lyase
MIRRLPLLAVVAMLPHAAPAGEKIVVPEFDTPHPRLLLSKADVERVRARVAANQYPHILSWDKLLKSLEPPLSPRPYVGKDPVAFYKICHPQAARARDLALAYRLGGEEKNARAAIEILKAWSGAEPRPGTQLDRTAVGGPGVGMYLSRAVFPMMYAADLLWDDPEFSGKPREAFSDWLRLLVPQIKASIEDWDKSAYYGEQDFNNHLAAHVLGLTAIGTLLGDRELLQYALDSGDNPRDFAELVDGMILMPGDAVHRREPPDAQPSQAGEIYDRYRHHTGPLKGIQYAYLSLELLSLTAEIARTNGLDLWSYSAPGGESLRLPFEFYPDFFRLEDTSLKGGFYSGETKRIGKGNDNGALFELGLARFPDSTSLPGAVWVSDRAKHSDDLAGPLVLTHGVVFPGQEGLRPRPTPPPTVPRPPDAAVVVPKSLPPHPRLVLDAAGLNAMKARALSGEAPWQESWEALKKQADKALANTPLYQPYTGSKSLDFFNTLLPQAQATRDLALAWWITGDVRYADAAKCLLARWAGATPLPGTEFSSSSDELAKGMLIPRSLLPMIWAFDILAGGGALDDADSARFTAWLAALVPQIKDGNRIWRENEYFDHQDFQNHLVAENLGLIAIAVGTGDTELLAYAVNSTENERDTLDLIAGMILMPGDSVYYREPPGAAPPQAGEIMDRYRHFQMGGHFRDYVTHPNRGLQYGLLSAHLLALSAQILSNNGLDLWNYRAPGGETLELPFAFYAPFYAAMDSTLEGGFYAGETERMGLGDDNGAVFEIAARHFPRNEMIRRLLDRPGRAKNSTSLLGFEALIFGAQAGSIDSEAAAKRTR